MGCQINNIDKKPPVHINKKKNINIELPKKLNLQKVQSEYRPNTANKTR